jgi:hypothetical protein
MAPTDGPLPSLSDFEDDPVVPTLTPRSRQSRGEAPVPVVEHSDDEGDDVRRGRGRPRTRPASQTATGFTRSSNIQVPAGLLGLIKERRVSESLTTGELIIAAIEATADQMPGLLATRPVTGGSLFSARASHAARPAEPFSNLNFRMTVEDFDVLDALVARFEAASRSQLVAAALTAYLT